MLKIFYFIFIFTCTSLGSMPDSIEYYPFRVDSIEIKGNKITDRDIITRELTFKEGDSITYENIQYNRERIYSLGIFNRVDLFTFQDSAIQKLVIDVEESWYIYPVPFAELKDKSWNKISYGFDFYVKNFRGRNEFIRLRASFGYDPNFYINYTVPSLTSDGNYYLFTDLSYMNQRNKSRYAYNLAGYNFDQKIINAVLGGGRRFGIYHRLSMNAGYTYVDVPFNIDGITVSGQRIDRYPSFGLNYIFDTRDLVQFPKDGIYFNSAFGFKGLGVNDINYEILNLDFREYRNLIGRLYAKWRLAGRFAFGKEIPSYDLSYLGYAERIRGFYSREMEGHNLYLGSAEVFYQVIDEMRINLDFIPIIPDELLHYRAGLIVQMFTDSGTTRFRSQKISTADFISGYGIGFTVLILPYNILRSEFAVSENGLKEWIVDLGISF